MKARPKNLPPQRSFFQAKEAVESVLFALILAFVFRGFVGQAFVIPTGSMAPTLLGRHIDHLCSSCGYSFAVSYDRGPVSRVKCPNCDWEEAPGEAPMEAGDGIFTVTWPFAVGADLLDPHRWDVIVFKAPFNIQTDAAGLPLERDGQTNYIKRLVGLPGDILMILDGDLYRADAAAVPEPIRTKLSANPPERLTAPQKDDLNKFLHIVHKPDNAQNALWQVVFDGDYPPTKPSSAAWKPLDPAAGWKSAGRVFDFSGSTAQPAFLQLEGKDFKDNCRYNFDPRYLYAAAGLSVVTDLQLRTTATWKGGDGNILLRLSKRDRLYTVDLSPSQGTGQVRQSRLDGSEPQTLATLEFPRWKRNWPVQIALVNVDHQLQVWMADKAIYRSPDQTWTAAQALTEPPHPQGPIAQVGAANVTLQVRHLAVMRDIHYRSDMLISVPAAAFELPAYKALPLAEQIAVRSAAQAIAGRPGWATEDNPMLLRTDEYFMLGDNSPASLDSRAWWQVGDHLKNRDYRVGTVPADQLIGKAFFVYWPSWYRLMGMRIIPNIGQMRWIQ